MPGWGVVVSLLGLEVPVPFMTSERAGLLKCFVMLEPPARQQMIWAFTPPGADEAPALRRSHGGGA